MRKLVVAIIAAAFGLVIGFACGALLTAPDNIVMEKLVKEKKTLQKNLQDTRQDNKSLRNKVAANAENEERLRNELLEALREKERDEELTF